jgi:hypothetical protein
MQVLYQLTEIVVCAAWSFLISYILLRIIKLVPFLKLRVDEDQEEKFGSILFGLRKLGSTTFEPLVLTDQFALDAFLQHLKLNFSFFFQGVWICLISANKDVNILDFVLKYFMELKLRLDVCQMAMI